MISKSLNFHASTQRQIKRTKVVTRDSRMMCCMGVKLRRSLSGKPKIPRLCPFLNKRITRRVSDRTTTRMNLLSHDLSMKIILNWPKLKVKWKWGISLREFRLLAASAKKLSTLEQESEDKNNSSSPQIRERQVEDWLVTPFRAMKTCKTVKLILLQIPPKMLSN